VTSAGSRALPDRVRLSWDFLANDWRFAIGTAAALGGLVFFAWRGSRRPLPLALVAAVATSLIVNDAPMEVALGGLVGYLTLWRYDSPR
jgi:hypothetical protein